MFISSTPEADATGDLADYYAQQRASWGFLPDYAGSFSTRPDVAAAWANLNHTVRSGMGRRRFEIATIAAARARRSTYCTVAHSSFLRDVCHDEATLVALSEDPSGGTLEPVDRAVFRFATKVATDAASVDQADVDTMRAEGLSDADVADVVFAVAARLFFTAVLDGLGAQADAQTAATFSPGLLSGMVLGRPVLEDSPA